MTVPVACESLGWVIDGRVVRRLPRWTRCRRSAALVAAVEHWVAIERVPTATLNGSQSLVEPVKLASPEVKTASKL